MRIRAAFTLHTRSGRCYMAREYDKDGARHTQSTGQPVKPTLNDKGRTLAERAAVQIVPTVRVPTLQEYGRTFFCLGAVQLYQEAARQGAKLQSTLGAGAAKPA